MLKELLKARLREDTGYVLPVLEKQVLKDGKVDALRRRRDCFHPSEISRGFCPREWLLMDRNRDLYLAESGTAQQQLHFATGHALHEMVQATLGRAGVLWGNWKCTRNCSGGTCTFTGFKPDKDACPDSKDGWVYEEISVVDEELNIRGHTDGILVLRKGKFVFEFKSANTRTFSTLLEPLQAHKIQGMWYLDVLERNARQEEKQLMELQAQGHDVDLALKIVRMPYKGVIIVYMNKNDQSMREFLVDRNTKLSIAGKPTKETVYDIVQETKPVLVETLRHRDEGTLPPRLDECTKKSCPRARKCAARHICFAKD